MRVGRPQQVAHCSEDLGFFFEGHGTPQGCCTKERWDLTRFGCQLADELGSGGQKGEPARKSGETRESEGGSQKAGAEEVVAYPIVDPVWKGERRVSP